jgi:hypothetical protein
VKNLLLFQARIEFDKHTSIKTELRQRKSRSLPSPPPWTSFVGLRMVATSLNRKVTNMSLVLHYVIFSVIYERLSRHYLVCKITDLYCIVIRVTGWKPGFTFPHGFDLFPRCQIPIGSGANQYWPEREAHH